MIELHPIVFELGELRCNQCSKKQIGGMTRVLEVEGRTFQFHYCGYQCEAKGVSEMLALQKPETHWQPTQPPQRHRPDTH